MILNEPIITFTYKKRDRKRSNKWRQTHNERQLFQLLLNFPKSENLFDVIQIHKCFKVYTIYAISGIQYRKIRWAFWIQERKKYLIYGFKIDLQLHFFIKSIDIMWRLLWKSIGWYFHSCYLSKPNGVKSFFYLHSDYSSWKSKEINTEMMCLQSSPRHSKNARIDKKKKSHLDCI